MKSLMRASLAAAVLAATLPAQTTIYIPDNVANTGTCNGAPFGNTGTCATGCSYIVRVPVSWLNPSNPRLVEISVAPCGTGTWTSPTVIVGVGHVPSVLPLPFSFPNGGALGSFLDLEVIFDSALQGPFTWTAIQDTWSPLGFGAGGGTSFCWDGLNDIAIYFTFQPATVTGWNGGCHRTATEPFRAYAAGYQALASTTTGASGAKLRLDFAGCGAALYETNSPASSLDINGLQGSPFSPAVTVLPSNAAATVNFASVNAGIPFESVIAAGPILLVGGGALVSTNGQILGINPASALFWNGGNAPSFLTVFPGNFSVPINVGQGPYTISAQMLNFDPFHPDGFQLSQPVQLDVQ
jgi:hypothetical protein